MSRADRYMLSQLMVLFGFFSLVLVGVYWVNRAVSLFDRLVGGGQTAVVFLEFTALTLPNVIKIVLPVSAFVASVYVANRLISESEMVVLQATGSSPARLARPVLYFGVIVAVMLSLLAHVLVPLSRTQLNLRSAEVADNITARFLSEGAFIHPADGITLYIREITAQGELRDIFLSDSRKPDQRTTYTARRALLVRDAAGPKLLMFDGLAQTLRREGQRLATTGFASFAYDIGALIAVRGKTGRTVPELGTLVLLRADPNDVAETRSTRAAFLFEAHSRLAQPLLAIVAALLGFCTLMMGSFSRFGAWRQIVAAVGLLILTQVLNNAAANLAASNARLWPMIYLPVLFGLAVSGAMVWLAGRDRRRPRARAERTVAA